MKLSINWLKEFVKTTKSAEEIADNLTMAGLEVDEVIYGHSFSGIVVGRVISVETHPNADKLRIAKVDVGTEVLQIVCGATNLAAGQTVPVAIVGAKLGDFEIGKASLRGVESNGMICSEKELGLGDDHSGIMILEEGETIGEVFVTDMGSDTVLDVKVLANRPDCMSVIGLSREVAATLGQKFKQPEINLKTTKKTSDLSVKVENPVMCPRYVARFVTGVSEGESPKWLKDRLIAVGARPVGLLVDISNYVMFEYGQPLHFFDLDKLTARGGKIVVRSAKKGEQIKTLDGVLRKLDEQNLVIADSKEPIAIAGVMGGLDTEIDAGTKNILIEAAVFDKANIRHTSRNLSLRSEAVARFEKGISVESPIPAINRASELLCELAQGECLETMIDINSAKKNEKRITIDVKKMNNFLGTDITIGEASKVLDSLGFSVETRGEGLTAVAPWWRVDINENVDIYEEVIRVVGYDKVPSTLPLAVVAIPKKNALVDLILLMRQKLSTLGYFDVLTYSFIGSKDLENFNISKDLAYEIANPLVKEIGYLRTGLFGKMLEGISANQHLLESIRFFEIGKVFCKSMTGILPHEKTEMVLGTMGGKVWPIAEPYAADFFELKGVLATLFVSMGYDISFKEAVGHDYYTEGRSADIVVNGVCVGSLGEVSEKLAGQYDVSKELAVAVISIDDILTLEKNETVFRQFSKYQHVNRDISVIVAEDESALNILSTTKKASDLIVSVEVMDIFRGKSIEPGYKSVAVRIVLQSDMKTLTDVEIEEALFAVIAALEGRGGKIRSGQKST